MRTVQTFSDDYLDQCRRMTSDQVIRFLEDFRTLQSSRPSRSKLISLKVPENLLAAFKARAELAGVPYQTLIKQLMRERLTESRDAE